MCPNNPIGTVDLYLVTHHGLDQSGSPALVHALQPRVAVMQNGTRKGAGAEAMPTMRTSPGLEDIWQLHWSYGAGIEQNSAGVFIANVEDNATIAGVLTAPPRRRRPGARSGGAPVVGRQPAGGCAGAAPRSRGAAAGAAGSHRRCARQARGAGRHGGRHRRARRTWQRLRGGAYAGLLDQDIGAA